MDKGQDSGPGCICMPNVIKIFDTFLSNRSLDSARYVYRSLVGTLQGLA